MRRRKAIQYLGLLFGAGLAGTAGFEWWRLHRPPSIEVLEKNVAVLDELADTIIPETDTPGAKAAGVGAVILVMVRDCADRKSQNNLIEGFQDLLDKTKQLYGKPFGECTPSQRQELLDSYETAGRTGGGMLGKVRKQLAGDSFYTTLKKYTVLGYCTSKPGATEAMRYDYIPGKYVANIPLQPGQRSWSTR